MPAVSENVTAAVSELPESRVRVEAQVSPAEVERRMASTAKRIGSGLRVDGFRRGKVPPAVVIRQVGREYVLDETVRSELGRWYLEAVETADLKVVGDPDINLDEFPEAGQPLTFTFEVGVRPTATLGTYKGVEVGRREVEPDTDAVDAEIAQLRERMARLDTKDGAAEDGDFVVMDFVGSIDGEEFEGGSGNDQMLELGSGRFIPGFEEQLVGLSAGDEKTVEVTFPDEYHAEHLAGKAAQFAVKLGEVKHKVLPELDDEFAVDAAGFDTLDELKEDIATKMREANEASIEAEFREAALDAAVAEATIELPAALVEARAKELWDRMIHQLSHQGINKEMYLQISGRTEQDIVDEAMPDAAQALRREAVLAAVIEAESIEPGDGDILDALQASAVQEKTTPEKLRKRLEKNGRIDELVDDIAQRQAVDLIAEHAKAISVEEARKGGKLWTPTREEREADGSAAGGRGELWTAPEAPAASEDDES